MSRKWVSLGDSSNALLPFLLEMTESLAPSHSQEEVEGLTESDWPFLGQIPWHCSAGKKTEKRINKPVVPGEWSYLRHTVPLHNTMGATYLSIWNYSCALLFICVLFIFVILSLFFCIFSPVEGDQPVDFKGRDVPAQRMEAGEKRERQRKKEREGKEWKRLELGHRHCSLLILARMWERYFSCSISLKLSTWHGNMGSHF